MARPGLHDHPLVRIGKSTIHGAGAFARRDIRRGKRIIEYVGRRLSKREGQAELENQNAYIFNLNDEVDIDGSVDWNLARFLNHSCGPNCEAEIVRGRIWIFARRNIKAGEELTYNYSHELEGYEDRPCRCGARSCVGYIVSEEYFPRLRQRQPS